MEELTPITRKETFLAKAAGQEVETPTPITREEVFMDAIAKGGGSPLPPVTPSDNGKVLAVKDGAWAADSNYFLVTITSLKPNKTNAEIESAYLSGKNVYALYSSNYYRLEFANSTRADFALIKQDASEIRRIKIENGSLYSASLAGLPTVTQSDNGAEAIVKNGVWAKQKKKFIVTLTQTSPDFSGTMDKTVAEINAAYEAGQDVLFSINGGQAYVPLNIASFSSDYYYPSFECYLVNPNIGTGVIMYAYTQFTSDGTKQTYATKIYSLTPAS